MWDTREVLVAFQSAGDDDTRRLAKPLSDNKTVPWICHVDASGKEPPLALETLDASA